MTQFLLFTLAGPMASFGERAGNARRSSADRPTKSALIGMLGAALGLERADAAAQKALAEGYRVATRSWRGGHILRDYHTYQSLPRSHRAATRADALAQADKLETSITVREYLTDAFFDAAVAPAGDAPSWRLEALAEALQRPRFTLSLGRKSCPLAWPLSPFVGEFTTIEAAFDAYAALRRAKLQDAEAPRTVRWRAERSLPRAAQSIAVEDEAWLAPSNGARRRVTRIDNPGDRLRWLFEGRIETVVFDQRDDRSAP